jgi:two-component system LytT family response regulator
MTKIMIVEDDIIIAKGLDSIIKSVDEDIETTITPYSKEALEYANDWQYDLFFLDIQLLDYSGYELAKQIRNIDRYKLTLIVFITAIPNKELSAFKEIHCYDYIIKPFKDKEVIEIVKTLVGYCGIEEEKDNFIKFKQGNYMYKVNTKDIIYIESIHKKIKVTMDKEQIEVNNYTLYRVLNELPEDDFIQCHKSFIINRNYIKKINLANNLIELSSANVQVPKVPIGRKYKENLAGRYG